jgi:hypothetical protein
VKTLGCGVPPFVATAPAVDAKVLMGAAAIFKGTKANPLPEADAAENAHYHPFIKNVQLLLYISASPPQYFNIYFTILYIYIYISTILYI